MGMFSNQTIRAKLTMILMAVSAAAILLAGVSAFAIGLFMGVRSLKSDLVTLAQVLGDNCQAALTFNVPEDADEILATLRKKSSIDLAAIYTEDGRLFAAFSRGRQTPAAVVPDLDGSKVSWESFEVVQPVRLKGKLIGSIYLRNDLSEARTGLIQYSAAILAFMLLSFAVSYFLTLGLRGKISTPILRLASVARRVSSDQDYSVRASDARNDEVGELIQSFNNMLEQIQSRDRSLRASEEKFAQAFNLSPAMMILAEQDTGVVRDVNAAWLQALGRGRGEVLGKSLSDSDLLGSPMARDRILRRLDRGEPVREVESVFREGRDDERSAVLSAESIEIGGRKFIIAAGDDTTERRQMAEQLLQARKMEAVGRLAGGVAHDFNNVLAGIRGYAEIISMRPGLGEEPRKYAANIVQLTERASGLTRQLLSFSRRGNIKETRVNVNELVQEVTALLSHTIDRKIQIRSELTAARHSVIGDPSQLLHAILNVAVNARDAMPNGGVLSFTTAVMDADRVHAAGVREIEAREYLRLTVSDTGVGMEERVKKHIFEPFFTTKEVGRGTGLGLAAVYGTIKEHKGEVLVESEPGRGSHFHLFLPLAETTAEKPKPEEGRVVKGKGLVLLVDDEDVLREIGRRMLEEIGYEVVTAENGRRAVEIYCAYGDRISLVILDIIMPEMSGIEAYGMIKASNPEAKVIIASGFMPDQEMDRLLKDGIHGVIMKPFSMKELSVKLDQALGQDAH